MKPFLPRLEAGEVLIADGGLGSLLLEEDLEPGECPESVNLDRPRVLEEIAARYLEAGAEIVGTNTFGASSLKLSLFRLEDRAEEINTAGVAAARRAVGDRAYVAGSIGPTGRLLRPYGDTDPETVDRAFREQARILVEAGADLLLVETMTDLTEATLAVEAARSAAGPRPVAACMTFEKTPRGFHTIMGVDIPTAAREMARAGADVVGSNCGIGIETMIEVITTFRECSSLPLIAAANAGLPEVVGGRATYPETPEFTAEQAGALVAAGASIVGGCCGTTPAHTRALWETVRLLRPE